MKKEVVKRLVVMMVAVLVTITSENLNNAVMATFRRTWFLWVFAALVLAIVFISNLLEWSKAKKQNLSVRIRKEAKLRKSIITVYKVSVILASIFLYISFVLLSEMPNGFKMVIGYFGVAGLFFYGALAEPFEKKLPRTKRSSPTVRTRTGSYNPVYLEREREQFHNEALAMEEAERHSRWAMEEAERHSRWAMEEAEKVTTPVSHGGYEMSFDMAVQNSFNDFGCGF